MSRPEEDLSLYLKLTVLARLAPRIHRPLPSIARVIGTYRHVDMYGFFVGPGDLNEIIQKVFLPTEPSSQSSLCFGFCTDLQADCPDYHSLPVALFCFHINYFHPSVINQREKNKKACRASNARRMYSRNPDNNSRPHSSS